MATLTKAQQAELAEQLDRQFSLVHLRCDGYLVSAGMRRIGNTRLAIVVHVNGYIRGQWMVIASSVDELPEESRRFWRPQQKRRYPAKFVRAMEKAIGKRKCKAGGYYGTRIIPSPYWNRPRPFIRHLLQHNESVEIIDYATYMAEMEAMEKELILAESRDG